MFVETERLILRDFSRDDVPDVFGYAKSERVGPAAGWAPHKSIEETAAAVDEFIKDGTTAIVLKSTGRVVGSVGLHDTSVSRLLRSIKGLEIGYVLGERCWGRGLMSEAALEVARHAFCERGVGVLWCGCFEGNRRSARVAEKLGFREAYVKKTRCEALGRVVDEHILFLTDDMFFERFGGCADKE